MKEIELSSWHEFEEEIEKLEFQQHTKDSRTRQTTSPLLYRGQCDSSWKLETTLDRFFSRKVGLNFYYKLALIAKPKIETFTNHKWNDVPTLEKYHDWVDNIEISPFHEIPAYEYFAYLRHHGFPSPLLDWTASPYVAAFFAFNKCNYNKASIYVYQEYSGNGKTGIGGKPAITSLGPNICAHKRHFIQQSQYTICTVTTDGSRYYAKHEDVIQQTTDDQDLLWKFNLPASERKEVLGKLNRMNINAFSLFVTEESLLETIATSEIFLKDRDI